MKMFVAAVVLILAVAAQAQFSRHDPLNAHEIELMREYAQEPQKRIELLLGFSRERMMAIDRLRAEPTPDGTKIGDLLTEFSAVIDELDDNLAMYNSHSEDLRRPLRHVIKSEAEFQQKLKTLRESASPLQKRGFAAALDDASDALDGSAESARTMLADQLAKKGEEKDKEKHDKSAGGREGEERAPLPGSTGAPQTPPEH